MNDVSPAGLLAVDIVNLTVRTLAVVGGAALGGLGVSGLARVLAGSLRQSVPVKLRWALRGLGGIAAGWIMALYLFGPGGSGFGGSGGLATGGVDRDKGPGSPALTGTQQTPPTLEAKTSTSLRIEVLGDAPLRKLGPEGRLDAGHCYRIEDEKPPRLRNLAEIKQLVQQRLAEKPALKQIEVVLYRDSPERKVSRARELEKWLDDLVADRKDPGLSYFVNDKVAKNAPLPQ